MLAEILILVELARGPRHGYQIRQAVAARFGGLVPLTNSQLYPALRALTELGAITGEHVPQEGRPDKHLYQLTDQGPAVLHDLLVDCPEDKAARPVEFYVRVGCFHLLSAPERRMILLHRRAALLKRRAKVGSWKERGGDPSASYLERLARLRIATFDLELSTIQAWLDELKDPTHPDPQGRGDEEGEPATR